MTPNVDASLRSQVREAIEAAWKLARASLPEPASAGSAPADPVDSAVTIEHPADATRGDFASNIALKLAKPYRRAPMEIAKAIAAHVATTATDPASPIAAVEVAPPGFLNIRLDDHALAAMAQDILRSTSTSSSSRPTPPGRSTSATPAAPSPATCSAAS
jgi:arginyl-tRNA synthetase